MARVPHIRFVLAASMLIAGCNALKDVLPTEPTASPSPTTSQPVLAIPVVLPAPVLGTTPSPAASPTPTPAPNPTPSAPSTPTASSCALPASNPANPVCDKTAAVLLGKLEKAITAATQVHPEYFDLNDKKCDNCYRVVNETGYFNEVQRQRSSQGVCSEVDADEIGLKSSNGFSEWYDIYLGSGHIRRGNGAYLYSCNPANF